MQKTLSELLTRVTSGGQDGHPLAVLARATDGHVATIAARTEHALCVASQLHSKHYQARVKALVDDPDPRNVRSILGEFRALADVTRTWGAPSVQPRGAGADFRVRTPVGEVLIEVATVLGSTRNTRVDSPATGRRSYLIKEVAYAPFGFATDSRPNDTVQGNAVSRLAAYKDDEHQASALEPTLLWLDLDDAETFPLPLGLYQNQPVVGGGNELVSGALWWANYGEVGDHTFDSWPLDEPVGRSYRMEFPGRFAEGSTFAAVVHSAEGAHVVLENHRRPSLLSSDLRRELLRVPGTLFESCWLDWPIQRSLERRVADARAVASVLAAHGA